MIAIVALIVIGPEKLPKVARTIGALVGRMQRYVATVKEEVNRETRFAELQELQQEIKRGVESTRASIVQNVQDFEQHTENTLAETKTALEKNTIEKTNTPDLFDSSDALTTQAKPAKKAAPKKAVTKKEAVKAIEIFDETSGLVQTELAQAKPKTVRKSRAKKPVTDVANVQQQDIKRDH